MYHANVVEKLIMERSGHLTKDGVRSYETTSSAQLKTLCRTLAASVPSTENTATLTAKEESLSLTNPPLEPQKVG